jgi:hypothetical protein
VQAWQQWLADLPPAISCILKLGKTSGGLIKLRLFGLSVQSESKLKVELTRLQKLAGPAADISTKSTTFLAAATVFNGDGPEYESVFQKAKSDYVTDAMSEQGILTLLRGLQSAPVSIAVLFDSYGGEINKVASDATAFFHRGKTRYSIQYTKEWTAAADTDANVAMMRTLHTSMRPFVSGGAYVNYCDRDLHDGYAKAYWGDNLPRLMRIKAQIDPDNVFRHAQSVPTS